ncbi:MAG: 50S ribosomal protein L1 [Gammaproteobacteria bacterium]
MAVHSKRMRAIHEKVVFGKIYSLPEALKLLQEVSTVKFAESVEVSVNLGVDPRKSDQMVRGSTLLPKGSGRTVRVAVFAQGAPADAAKEAGADIVGFEDLVAKVKAGELDFDVVIATPDAMRTVGPLGQILGPRGLMPNPKDGTVTADVAKAVTNAKAGQARYRTDKNGIVHCAIGKVNFALDDLKENLLALMTDLKKAKPTTLKGVYMKKLSLSTTMGPGLQVDLSTVSE